LQLGWEERPPLHLVSPFIFLFDFLFILPVQSAPLARVTDSPVVVIVAGEPLTFGA
jgi:hypothetical protein